MTLRFIRLLCAFMLFSWGINAQDDAKPLAYLGFRDTVLLTVKDGQKIIFHTVKPKQTLFSLAKFYGLSLEQLYEYNPDFQDEPVLKVGKRVNIPIPNIAIKRYPKADFSRWKNASIYYLVQDGDNLYQIAKRHFNMPVDTILKRNRLANASIHAGQLIHMGWLGTEGIPAEWQQSKKPVESDALKRRFDEEKSRRKIAEGQGVCFWHRDSKEKGDLYALHREAAVGTIVAVYNPMSRHTVYAKVIGRIPAGYESNVEVILSPAAARKIGARDPRFFVKVTFFR